jgi:hypothetical protein
MGSGGATRTSMGSKIEAISLQPAAPAPIATIAATEAAALTVLGDTARGACTSEVGP